jgi:hypothetical protein|tara:strand:+ start:18088 stop:18300 length:213 start_codon:yes stop_codon:yes gene_type:complete
MKIDVTARIIGSALAIISYFIILHVSATLGAMMMLVSDAISMPYFIRTKSWDVVLMIAFLLCISSSKLFL